MYLDMYLSIGNHSSAYVLYVGYRSPYLSDNLTQLFNLDRVVPWRSIGGGGEGEGGREEERESKGEREKEVLVSV